VSLPQKTVEKLNSAHPFGTRHQAKMDIALSMFSDGLPIVAVIETLRQQFPQAAQKEIDGVAIWAQDHAIPRTPRSAAPPPRQNGYHRPNGSPEPKASPRQLAGILCNGTAAPDATEIPGGAVSLLRALYAPGEFINIVCAYTLAEKDGVTKANPSGAGMNKRRDGWLEYFERKGVPRSKAGAWMRPNPVAEIGSGHEGAITNEDVTSFRFLLIESDELTIEEQRKLYAKLRLPLAAIITSGGKSCHGWLRLDAEDAEEYADKAQRILAIMEPLGFDRSNKNPSRLSRLPGATRIIGAHGDGAQRLLHLDAHAPAITEDDIERLAAAVKPPKFAPRNMRDAVLDALDVYDEIYRNKAKTGLRTGFPMFDSLTGGLKPGWLTIVAGETNSGKTSFVLNIILNALNNGKRVALFSFEMDLQEILDIFFSRECSLNRNKFNNGYFAKGDFPTLTNVSKQLAECLLLPFDDPMMSINDVMDACAREQDLALVVIDYLQLANCEHYRESREQQIAYVSRMSKALAKKMRVPVIGVSQLNEEGKVRESRGIAHDANCIIKLSEQPAKEGEEAGIEGKIIKGRSIPKGSFNFRFERQFCRFTETGCDPALKKLLPKEENKNGDAQD
jgi:KaiC/GvpD/RAD55 family RecA-like ATPase